MQLQLVEAQASTRNETYQLHCHHMLSVEYRGKILCAYFNDNTKQKKYNELLGSWAMVLYSTLTQEPRNSWFLSYGVEYSMKARKPC